MYSVIRKMLFLFPAESVHYFSMNVLKLTGSVPVFNKFLTRFFGVKSSAGTKRIFGLHFKNQVGLGAGFDKNAKYLKELEMLGFGFVEVGTVTPLPQAGNDKPRLFRLPKDRALINRMGFNNEGVHAVAARLQRWKETSGNLPPSSYSLRLIVGGNIGKNKVTANENAWKDYEICFRELFNYVDYFVVNVSSPNTPGLRELQEKDSLRKILSNLQLINSLHPTPKPLLLKIAPDLTREQLDDVIDLAMELKLHGLVATNTTIERKSLRTPEKTISEIGAGGLSGKPMEEKATAVVKYIVERSGGTIPVIASGGIFTGADALKKLTAGADLVQVWTGFIYEGPSIVKKISAVLAKREAAG